jgi:hypothetical protein
VLHRGGSGDAVARKKRREKLGTGKSYKGREGKGRSGMGWREGGKTVHLQSAHSIYNLKDRNILEKKNILKGDADGRT